MPESHLKLNDVFGFIGIYTFDPELVVYKDNDDDSMYDLIEDDVLAHLPPSKVLGLLVEVLKKGFQKHVASTLKIAGSIFTSAINAITKEDFNFSSESAIPFWYSSGSGACLNLKRAEKARIRVTRFPAIVDNLNSKTFAWEDERNTPFLYDGIRLVSILEEYKL